MRLVRTAESTRAARRSRWGYRLLGTGITLPAVLERPGVSMRMSLKLLACATALMIASPAAAQVILNETFSGPATGWTTGAEWQIGETSPGIGQADGTYPDPASD